MRAACDGFAQAFFAEFVIVVLRTGAPESRSTDALSWFLVPTDTPGVIVGERWQTLGLRAMDLSPLELRDAVVPDDHRLGSDGRGLAIHARSMRNQYRGPLTRSRET